MCTMHIIIYSDRPVNNRDRACRQRRPTCRVIIIVHGVTLGFYVTCKTLNLRIYVEMSIVYGRNKVIRIRVHLHADKYLKKMRKGFCGIAYVTTKLISDIVDESSQLSCLLRSNACDSH